MTEILKQATFVKSSINVMDCPDDNLPEYAFIGRSNVGKSSLINMLTNRVRLAKTSARPGKTQLINHFIINKKWYLVDLPGYGFAKLPAVEREKMEKMFRAYILNRQSLVCLFVLIDARLEPQKSDLEFLGWLGNNNVPFVIVFTKTDKLTSPRLKTNIESYQEKLLSKWETLPQIFITSVLRKKGRNEILDFISNTNETLAN